VSAKILKTWDEILDTTRKKSEEQVKTVFETPTKPATAPATAPASRPDTRPGR